MITKSKYEAIKAMLKSGVAINDICKLLRVKIKTIEMVRKSENYEQYKHDWAANNFETKTIKKQKKLLEQEKNQSKLLGEYRQSATVQVTHFMETKMDKVIELMTEINGKLDFLIDDIDDLKVITAKNEKKE